MSTDTPSMSDSQFEEMFASYIAALERSDQSEIDKLMEANPAFAVRIKAFEEFESSMQGFLPKDSAESTESKDETSGEELFGQGTKPLLLPRTYGHYELVDVVGEGGMGIVYKAKQLRLGNRIVALKLSRFVEETNTGKNARHASRFQTEIDVAAKLDHPNIVPVFESGHHEGRHFISMKLIEGTSLRAVAIASQSEEVRRLILITDAVQHAHDRGVLHRDLKPQNVIVDHSGVPFVSDFGLAKLLGASQSVTRTGATPGTPQYMSPEQAEGKHPLTVATDIYAIGTILFERICNKPLYDPDSIASVLTKVRFGARPNLRMLNGKCDRDLCSIIRKCLELLPTDRYESCRDLKRDLELWQRGEPLESRSVSSWRRGIRWARLHPLRVLISAIMLVGLISVIGLYGANAQHQWRYQITEYSRHVQIAKAELSERQPGWRGRAYESLDVANKLSFAPENKRELSSLRANCDIGFDIGAPLYSIEQTNTVAVKFHPTKPLLFLARKYPDDNEIPCPILVVDTKSGKVINKLLVFDVDRQRRCTISDIALIPNSESIAVLSSTQNLIVLSIAQESFGQLIKTQSIPLGGSSLQEINGTESLIIAGINDKSNWQLMSFDTSSWSVTATKELPDGLSSMTQASDKQRLITCEPKRVEVRDPKSLELVWCQIPIEQQGNIAYSKDQVAVISPAGIGLYSVPHPLKTFQLDSNPSKYSWLEKQRNLISFSGHGNILAAGDNERHQVALWDTTDRLFLQTIYLKDSMYQNVTFDFSKDGLLAVFSGNETVVYSVKQPTLEPIASLSGPISRISLVANRNELFTIAFFPDNDFRADLSKFSFANDISTQSNNTVLEKLLPDRTLQLATSPDERLLAATITEGFAKVRIKVFDVHTLDALGNTNDLSDVRNALFDSTGKLYATVKGGLASFSPDLSQMELQWTRPQIEGALLGSTKYPVLERLDDTHYFVGDEDGWLSKLHWTAPPKAMATIRLGDAPLWSSSLCIDKRIIVVGDGSGSLFVLDTSTCELIASKSDAHLSRITGLAWTESGHLVSVGLDKAVKFWSWNDNRKSLDEILKVQLRSNARQVIARKSDGRKEEVILLREGANVVERLTVDLP